MTRITDLSNIDFRGIRSQLKEFLQTQDEFKDYDFDGSGLSTLVDLLAYNTHMNAVLGHINMNETFLDTARVRSNVVSHAQAIGYVPKSRAAAKGIININVKGIDSSSPSLNLPKGQKFTGSINGEQYTFVTLSAYTAEKLSDDTYNFVGVDVYEGEIKSELYRVDSKSVHQEVEINSTIADLSTLRVFVYDNAASTAYKEYTFYDNIVEVRATDEIFFVRENSLGRYVIYFGDGIIGKQPEPGAVIMLEWLNTSGSKGNNIKTISSSGAIDGESAVVVSMSINEPMTFGGKESESIDSIRYNAPVSYAVQNRAVSASDYKILLIQKFPELKDISVWGGEDANPPVYGKVYISPALFSQQKAGEVLKKAMTEYLRYRNIGSVTTEIVDAEYTFLAMTVKYKYDTKNSNVNEKLLSDKIRSVVMNYNERELGRFDGIMRQSNLTTEIDRCDEFITSNVIYVDMMKQIIPDPLKETSYTIEYPVQIYSSDTNQSIGYSSIFVYNGTNCAFADEPHPTNTFLRNLYIIDANTGNRITQYTDKGFIDTAAGKVVIQNMKFDTSNPVQFFVRPNTYDISPRYKQLIVIHSGYLQVAGELDTVSVYNVKGLATYSPFTRHNN